MCAPTPVNVNPTARMKIRIDFAMHHLSFDKTVSVAKSYTAVTYECEIDSDRFQVKLATYDSDNGEEQLNDPLSKLLSLLKLSTKISMLLFAEKSSDN